MALIENLDNESISVEKRDEMLESLARKVVAKRLETPAIFLLESHKPLSFIASQSLLLSAPILGAFFGFREVNMWAKMLEDRQNVERLIQNIERLAEEKAQEHKKRKKEKIVKKIFKTAALLLFASALLTSPQTSLAQNSSPTEQAAHAKQEVTQIPATPNAKTASTLTASKPTAPPVVKKKPNRRIPGVEHISWFMALLMVAFLVPVFAFIYLAKKGKKLFLRRLPGVDAIDEAIGRAVEMGRPMIFTTGLVGVGPVLFACLGILNHIAQRAATYATKLFVPQNDPEVMAITQEVVHQAYRGAGREDMYDPECVRYLSPNQFAYASGYMGLAHREKASACFLFGAFAAESLILAEAGQQVGAIQVAGTVSKEQIPFFVTTCDYTIIGEELFAVSAYLTREPVLLGSLRGQDIAKLVIFLLIIIGVIVATIYQVSGYNLEFATWIIKRPVADF